VKEKHTVVRITCFILFLPPSVAISFFLIFFRYRFKKYTVLEFYTCFRNVAYGRNEIYQDQLGLLYF